MISHKRIYCLQSFDILRVPLPSSQSRLRPLLHHSARAGHHQDTQGGPPGNVVLPPVQEWAHTGRVPLPDLEQVVWTEGGAARSCLCGCRRLHLHPHVVQWVTQSSVDWLLGIGANALLVDRLVVQHWVLAGKYHEYVACIGTSATGASTNTGNKLVIFPSILCVMYVFTLWAALKAWERGYSFVTRT